MRDNYIKFDQSDQLIIQRNSVKWLLAILFCLISFVLFVYFSIDEYTVRSNNIFFYIGAIIFGVFLLLLPLSLLPGVGTLTLDPTGLSIKLVLRSKHWRWAEIGPVVAGDMGHPSSPILVAFTAENAVLCANAGKPVYPKHMIEADIELPIAFMKLPPSIADSTALADLINKYREEYADHSPQVFQSKHTIDPSAVAKFDEMLGKKLKRKHHNFFLMMSSVFLFFAALMFWPFLN